VQKTGLYILVNMDAIFQNVLSEVSILMLRNQCKLKNLFSLENNFIQTLEHL
jgi:uncharacterized pyridoxamine 5'-phosphate oxidase family protein